MQTQIVTNLKLIHLRHFIMDQMEERPFKYHEPVQWHACPLTCHRGTRKSSNLISRKCGITFCPANTVFSSTFPCRDFSIILGELFRTEVGKVRTGSKKSEGKSPSIRLKTCCIDGREELSGFSSRFIFRGCKVRFRD